MNLIEGAWLKVGPISNQLFDTPDASAVLNHAHHEALLAIDKRDCAAVRRAIEKDLFVAGQFLRRTCSKAALFPVD
jgi:DNA-binding GntR family transcriptional regulator